jgi:hypothetical protein
MNIPIVVRIIDLTTLTIFISSMLSQTSTMSGHGILGHGQQKRMICSACFIMLYIYMHQYVWTLTSSDVGVDSIDSDNNRTDYFTPCTCIQGKNTH